MVVGDAILKIGFQIAIAPEIIPQNDEVEWQHLGARCKVDIIFLMSSEDKLINIHDSKR